MKRKSTPPTPAFPAVDISRLWDKGERGEEVAGLGKRTWRVSDLRVAVANEPVYEVPLAFLDLAAHEFRAEGGLLTFAQHMRHVNECDTSDPIIMDQWGRILDGRHRIVKALLEGKTTIPAKKVPDGTDCTYYIQ